VSAGCGLDQRPAVVAARSLALAFAIVLLAGDAALAVCTPASPVNNATVTCTGITIDQNSAAGYGTSADTGNVITVTAAASVIGTGSRDGLIFGTATVVNYGTITGGLYGIQAGANFSDITNTGTIAGSIAAIQFFGGSNTLTLAPGSVINGLVQSTAGGNIFQLGGSGAGTFDISALGDTAQYRNFGTFNKIDSSVWTLTGAATFGGDVNVNGGTLLVNGSLASAGTVFVSPGATLGGTGTLPSTFLDDGATLAPGTPTTIGTLTVNTILLFCNCSVYSVKVSGLSADKTQVNGDVYLSEAPVVATVTGSSIAKRYTILTASRAGACGWRASVAARPPTATPRSDRTRPRADSVASPLASITGSPRRPLPALRSQVAARISASPMAEAGVPTCSRPAPSFVTRLDRPISLRRRPMAGRTSLPIAP
jgi:autotransporter-associated beta strand protein